MAANLVIRRETTIVASIHPTVFNVVNKVMAGSIVNVSFTYFKNFTFKVNDYVVVDDKTYTMNTEPKCVKEGTNKYTYDCIFEDNLYTLGKVMFMCIGDSEFDLVGDAGTFIQLLVENMNRIGSGWTMGAVDVSVPAKNIHFSCENCLSVIQKLATQDTGFDCEFYLVGKQINFQEYGIDNGRIFRYGYNRGFYSIARDTVSSTNIVTRLHAYGSQKNIPTSYRGYSPRLKFVTAGASYVENNVHLYGVIEHSMIWENIYPRRTGTISWVDPNNVMKFRDTSMNFDLLSYLMPGTVAKIHIQSGLLGGYEFQLTEYNHITREFTIIEFDDGKGGKLPNTDIRLAPGDTYVLIDIYLPAPYITAAETLLLTTAQAYVKENSVPRVTYTVACDPLYFTRNNIKLKDGDYVTITDTEFGLNRLIRIAAITEDKLRPGAYALTLSDNIEKSMLSRMYANVLETKRLVERGGLTNLPHTKNPWRTLTAGASKEYVDAVKADLQNQIDGNITSWYYPYNPTLLNVPASNWTAQADRLAHQGDTFTNTLTGMSWKFLFVGTSWEWKDISDTMAAQALAAAVGAQETADGKIRCFKITPVTPYDMGDLWVDGSNIRTCNTARGSGAYVVGDWGFASTYDNTKDSIDSGIITTGGIYINGTTPGSGAGMDGSGTALDSVVIWAGENRNNRELAQFQVLRNGKVILNNWASWFMTELYDGVMRIFSKTLPEITYIEIGAGEYGAYAGDRGYLKIADGAGNNITIGSQDILYTGQSRITFTSQGITLNRPVSNLEYDSLVGRITVVSVPAYDILDTDTTIVVVYIGSIYLPLALLRRGRIITIKRIMQPGTVTILRTGTNVIDGATSISLQYPYEAITVQSDGASTWHIIGRV